MYTDGDILIFRKQEREENKRLTRAVHDVGSVANTIIEFDGRFTHRSSASLGLLFVSSNYCMLRSSLADREIESSNIRKKKRGGELYEKRGV